MVMPRTTEPPPDPPIPLPPDYVEKGPPERGGVPPEQRGVHRLVPRWLHHLSGRGVSGACEAARAMSGALSRHGRGLFVWLLEITGASMIAAGVGFIYWPAGLIVAGVMVILIAVYGVEFPAEETE